MTTTDYFAGDSVTTPSYVTARGTINPSVNAVTSKSPHRLRTRILRSVIPLPPATCAASAFRSAGSLILTTPQTPKTARLVTEKRLPAGGCPAGDAIVTGTPSV